MSDTPSRTTPAALARLRALAEAGDADACVQLGRCLAEGWGCRSDEGAALGWFLSAARAGHGEAAWRAARLALRMRGAAAASEPDVLARLEESAYAGQAEARALLGWCLQHARLGAPADPAAANRWLRLAALDGSAHGRYLYALNLMQGRGVERDCRAAVALLELAAEQGDLRAQLELGVALCEGRGTPRDVSAALAWYRAAARRGYARAQFNLGLLLLGGEAPEQDDAEAATWIAAAAAQGLGKAQYTLATLHRRGLGVPQDAAAASLWLTRAAEGGHARAQYRLSRICEARGETLAARRWLEAAANGGSTAAQARLAQAFAAATDPRDRERAAGWFRRAAEAGDARAMHGLGVCHYRGLGVPRDLLEAYVWFCRAATSGLAVAISARDRLARKLGPEVLASARHPARRPAP